MIDAPKTCGCCGSARLAKLGEAITETLEVIPRQWKVVQTVREKFTCRDCETITQPPAPFHPIARGRAGPSLLAMILVAKFGEPSAAESPERGAMPARASISSLPTLADQVGACRRTGAAAHC